MQMFSIKLDDFFIDSVSYTSCPTILLEFQVFQKYYYYWNN